MREEGLIRGWGLGVNVVEPCLRTLEESDPDVFLLAGRYTLLDFSALQELLPACAARGVGVVIGGPYNSGLLAGGKHFNYVKADQEHLVIRNRILDVCRKHRVDLKAAALQFCAAHPAVACVIPGANHPDQVRENITLMKLPIPASFWADLKSKGLIPAEAPTPRAQGLSFRPTTQ
jgi:D-threo-aldose 1-dehydrogenase